MNPLAPYQFLPCRAETLRALDTADLATGQFEKWFPCGGRALKGDLVCSAHRKQINLAASLGGSRVSGNAIIKVPWQALTHVDTRFPGVWFKNIVSQPDVSGLGMTDDSKIEIWESGSMIKGAVYAYAKLPPV